MTRSSSKGPFLDSFLFQELFKKASKLRKRALKFRNRQSVIFPSFVARSFNIHNGLRFLRVKILENMVGHKLGEFAFTRKRHIYLKKKKKKKK
jgi:small subunit ribosomal protein S19